MSNDIISSQLGLKTSLPAKPFRAAIAAKLDVDYEIFKINLNSWKKIISYNYIDSFKQPHLQVVSKTSIDNYVVLALSTDYIAGEWSESYYGYIIMTPEEYKAIEAHLARLAKQKPNGLHQEIIWTIKQDFTGDKIYLNYFNGVQVNDCEDDGVMRYITPKRAMPRDLWEKLPIILFDWEAYEYRKQGSGTAEWMIILQSEFESDEVYLKNLEHVNKIIEEYDNAMEGTRGEP